MLDALREFALREGLAPEPGFAPKNVRWAVEFAADGRYLGLLELGDLQAKRNVGRRMRCPEFPSAYMQAGGRAHFLVETAEVVVLHRKEGAPPKQAKQSAFLSLLYEAAAAVPDFGSVAKALSAPGVAQGIRADLAKRKAKPTDNLVVRWDGVLLPERDDWQDWWRQKRGVEVGQGAGSGDLRVCLATGDLGPALPTHPKIKGIGTPEPVLIGCDKEAFCSYGLEKSENAPVGESAAEAYRQALNQLLRDAPSIAGSRVVHWYSTSVPPDDDALAYVVEAPETTAADARTRGRALLNAIADGERPGLTEARYYAMTLTGAGGRVMVRDWMQGTFGELAAAVCAWFEDLELVGAAGGTMRAPKFETVVLSLLPPLKPGQDRARWQLAATAVRTHLWESALRPAWPIPFGALSRAVREHCLAVIRNDVDGALEPARFQTRLAVMRAYHVRKGREQGTVTMTPNLNEQHPHPAYHCGRALAVYAALQRAALGDVNAGVVERYYAAASATPGWVLGRLAKLATFHTNKLRGQQPGLAHWYEERLAAIWGRIRDGLPRALTLEEQSLFALGYYHQLAHDRTRRDRTAAGEGGSTQENRNG